jgi:hypothetical protein
MTRPDKRAAHAQTRHRGGSRRRRAQLPVSRVPPNQVIEALAKLDTALTPTRRLRRWRNGAGVAIAKPPAGRLLLLVHGTFGARCKFEELAATPEARRSSRRPSRVRLRADVRSPDAVDEPVAERAGPLARARRRRRPIDVICHSRRPRDGWWLFRAPPVKRVISLAAGGDLAAPRDSRPRSILGNRAVGTMSSSAATAVPPSPPPAVSCSAECSRSRRHALDAGIAVVRGLASQSRVANNYSCSASSPTSGQAPGLHSVSSDYATGAGRVVEVLAAPADSRPHRRTARKLRRTPSVSDERAWTQISGSQSRGTADGRLKRSSCRARRPPSKCALPRRRRGEDILHEGEAKPARCCSSRRAPVSPAESQAVVLHFDHHLVRRVIVRHAR